MGIYATQVVPRFTDVTMNRADLRPIRDRVASGLAGEVLEVGFGSGLNLPHYPPAVTRVLAVDPAQVGRNLAARRIAASPVPVEFAGLDGQRLPWPDGRFDHVLLTWTLCTIPDPRQALAEIYRVLRPGGEFHFADHGRSPDPQVARWQDRLTPLQRRLAGGCHLNRPIGELIAGSGLQLTQMDNYYLAGPKPIGYTFEGRAAKPADAGRAANPPDAAGQSG
jgi:ubiquinone/menaquinone biosynthesis C-methylase UbiE